MTERVITFGPQGNLVGILTEPESVRRIGAPAVLLWNVGIHHRVGPSRIFVSLARSLAEAGYVAFRFDVSGLGDSEIPRNDQRSDHQRAMSDVREAMQLLRKRCSVERVVLVGFCSGVDAAHAVGVADPAVVGVVYLEGYTYETRSRRLRYPLRFLSLERWERWIRTRFPRWTGTVDPTGSFAGPPGQRVYVREYPTRDNFRADVRSMLAAGKRMLFVYVGGDTGYAYRDQLRDVLGMSMLPNEIEVEFLPDADHTFAYESDRDTVIRRVVRFMGDAFGATAPARESGAPRGVGTEGSDLRGSLQGELRR